MEGKGSPSSGAILPGFFSALRPGRSIVLQELGRYVSSNVMASALAVASLSAALRTTVTIARSSVAMQPAVVIGAQVSGDVAVFPAVPNPSQRGRGKLRP